MSHRTSSNGWSQGFLWDDEGDVDENHQTDESENLDILTIEPSRYTWEERMEIEIRSKENVRENGEVFTPFKIVEQMLDLLPESCWTDPEYCFLEPACGNGQFLVKIFERRVAAGISIEGTLNTLVGMDISTINIKDSSFRLFEQSASQMRVEGVTPQSKLWFERAERIVAIVMTNIFSVKDSLEYIKSGRLEKRRFFDEDPTGNNQVMTVAQQSQMLKRIRQRLQEYHNKLAGDAIGTAFAPFFKIG